MKKLLAIILLLQLAFGASAQHFRGGFHYYARPRVSVGVGLGFYPGYPYFGYSPFGYPGYRYGYAARPSKLTMQIEDIKADYKDKIWSAKHDKSIPRHERKLKVHELKHQRDQEIADLKRNYYKY